VDLARDRIALLVYVGFVVMLSLLENRLIFHPTRYPGGDWSVTDRRPPFAADAAGSFPLSRIAN
jgi:hypothetical protein